MTNRIQNFIASWQKAVETDRDLPAVLNHFTADAVLISPVLFKPITERAYLDRIITAIAELVPDLHYTETFASENGAAMVFKGHIGELEIEGIDIFEINSAGKATQIKVMVRPMTAVQTLAQEMMKKLAG